MVIYNCMTGMFVRRAMILFVGQKEEEEEKKDTCRQADITTTTTNGSCRFYRHTHMRMRVRALVHCTIGLSKQVDLNFLSSLHRGMKQRAVAFLLRVCISVVDLDVRIEPQMTTAVATTRSSVFVNKSLCARRPMSRASVFRSSL